MSNKKLIYIVILILFTVITRYALFLDNNVFLSDDDAGFALATHSYDIIESRPHLPGYILYIKAIGFLKSFFGSAHYAMSYLVNISSIISTILIFLILNLYFNKEKSFIVSLLILTNPLIWFYQCTPETYVFDLLFSCLIAYAFLLRKSYYLFFPLISILGGIRMSSAFFLVPLYLYITYIYYKEERTNLLNMVLANLLGLLVTLAWAIPLFNSVGGLFNYIELYETRDPMPDIGFVKNIVGFFAYAFSFGMPFYLLLPISFKKHSVKQIFSEKSIFFAVWVVPALIFFVTVHYSKGYIFLIYLPLIILLARLYYSKYTSNIALYIVIFIQIAFFLAYPYSKPDTESLIRRDVRQSSLVDVFFSRMNSGYLHSNDRLREYEERYESLDKCIKHLEMEYFNFKLFDGKSSGLTINAEAINYPRIEFVTQKDFNMSNEYIWQKGHELKRKNGLVDLYEEVYIICSNEMFNKYYTEYANQIFSTDVHSIIKIKPGKEMDFRYYYENLFGK